jgi:hypothetical protein
MVFREFITYMLYMFYFLVEAVLHINFILCRVMNIQNNDITQTTS